MNRPFVSVRAQYVAGLDFIRQSREVRLNLEFDFKNRPVAPYMAMVQGQPHIAFKTVPWQTVDEAQRARVIFDQWRRRRCLKDLSDWQDWIEFYRFTVACDANRQKGVSRGINYTAEGPVGVLRRLFLRAYTQQEFGLVPTLSYAELAAWLTASGYATTSDEVKNAKRAKLVENIVPEVAAVTDLMALLQEKFPAMESGKFLAPSLL